VYNADEPTFLMDEWMGNKTEPDFNNCPLILQFEEEIERSQ